MSLAIDEFVATIARLRAPGGCPWDQEQTHRSLRICLMEEVAELLETIDKDDYVHMREELGDLLLQVVMHAQMAAERGEFTLDDVAREVNAKMVRRHPHVFGDASAKDSEAVLRQWDEIKVREKKPGPTSDVPLFKALPPELPLLLKAREVWKAVRKGKIDLPAAFATRADLEARAVGLNEERAGAELFAWVAACQEAGIDPESALRCHVAKVVENARLSAKA
ncbi:MAG: MazG family protein [Puniceicoccales bacterium]|nr:MazG family protein [Puniceicoccales bacterium]